MNKKKLIFILGSPRSGTTLLLSYLCGLKNTKILYETKCLTNPLNFSPTDLIDYLANIFDSIDEEIVIEKTPEHVYYLDVIEQLRKVCKRDIHVIYVTRPPVPTVLSILKAKEVLETEDILGACEKYEESLVIIYNNLIVKKNEPNSCIVKTNVYGRDITVELVKISWYWNNVFIPYSFHVTYKGLTEDSYFTLYNLLVNELHLDLSTSDIRGLLVNRVSNLTKVLPPVSEEKHHSNLFKEVDVVNKERLSNVSSLVEQYRKEIHYITTYFATTHRYSTRRPELYDLLVKKQVIDVGDNPLVTIVVPLYNKEKYIEETLSSLLSQTYQNLRVVVIDDASTDSSLKLVEKYFSTLSQELQDKLWILRSVSNQGVSLTRNLGLAGFADIYSFCDADDVWDSTLVEKSVATFKKYPYVDCVYSRVLLLKDGEVAKNHSKICNGDVYEDSLEYNFLTCGSNIFVKASVIEEHNIRFNTSLRVAEDWDFLIQLAKVATFKCTKEYLVTYRQVPDSLSTNKELLLEDSQWVLMNHLGVGASHLYKGEKYSRIFTRLFLYYFTVRNLKWEYMKDLNISYILRVVISKLKALVKSHIL